jgi:quercetin dioxygenase-like cupin family protein
MNPLSIRGIASWDDPEDGPTEIEISRTRHMSVVCYCFEENQELFPHKAERDMAIYVERGRVLVTNGDNKVEMGPSQFLVVEAGQSRGIEARERAVVVVTQSPPENY